MKKTRLLQLTGTIQVVELIDNKGNSRGYLTGIPPDVQQIRLTFGTSINLVTEIEEKESEDTESPS